MPSNNENVGIAMALVIGAGGATALGAAVVFFPSLVRLASRKTLAGALGLSAGVMTYVSVIEIFVKSEDSFGDAGFSENTAKLYTTLCFFAGVLAMVALNQAVTHLLGGHHHHHPQTTKNTDSREGDESLPDDDSEGSDGVAPCICHDDDPGKTLDTVQGMAQSMAVHPDKAHPEGYHHHHPRLEHLNDGDTNEGENSPTAAAATGEEPAPPSSNASFEQKDGDVSEYADEKDLEEDDEDDDDDEAEESETNQKLMRMSLNTALAIALHNFPEGLATFVAALDDPKVGAVLAMAIAIHNIPEGLCVAMPIYYATGNKWRAFGWALLSGVSEPVAGLLGWAILANSFSDTLYALLFGMVSGMMVVISVRELLPTAHRYDPEDSVVTYCFIVGMAIIALSLMLFLL